MPRAWGPCRVEATTFRPQLSGYRFKYPDVKYDFPGDVACALPYHFPDPRLYSVDVVCEDTDKRINDVRIADCGPWNWTDPWWKMGNIPLAFRQRKENTQADNGRVPKNDSGIDLSWGLAEKLGLPREWKGFVFVTVKTGPDGVIDFPDIDFSEDRDEAGRIVRAYANGEKRLVCEWCGEEYELYLLPFQSLDIANHSVRENFVCKKCYRELKTRKIGFLRGLMGAIGVERLIVQWFSRRFLGIRL